MALNQDIRFTANGPADNPNGLYDFIKPTRKIKGVGAPASDLGQDYWEYLDTVSGIDYVKNNGVWEPYADFSSYGPGGGVPDPLSINQLNINRIQGNAGDGFELDAATGIVQVLGDSNAVVMQIGQPGTEDAITLAANGNIIAGSLIRGGQIEMLSAFNDLKLYNNGGVATVEAVGSQLHLAGQAAGPGQAGLVLDDPLYMNNKTITGVSLMRGDTDQDVRLSSWGVGDLIIDSGSVSSFTGRTIVSSNTTTEVNGVIALNLEGGTCTLKGTAGLDVYARGDVDIHSDLNNLNLFTTTGKIDIKSNLDISMTAGTPGMSLTDSVSGKVISFAPAAAAIATNSDNDFAISHILADKNLSLNTAGTGNIILNPGGNVNLNNKALTSVSSFNGSENESRAKSLSVIGGALLFREPPRNIIWYMQNAGSNNTFYGESGINTSPADFIAFNLGPAAHTLVQVSVRVNFNVDWTWGGGTSTLTVGTVLNSLPSTAANYVPLYTMNLDTAGNFYSQDSGTINVAIPADRSLVCRLVNAGTVSTSNNMEVSISALLY